VKLKFPIATCVAAAFLIVPGSGVTAGSTPPTDSTVASASASAHLIAAAGQAGLRQVVLELAIDAHARVAAAGRTSSPLLTIIDYSLPSRERRLWVLDLERDTVLARELVAHGRSSGGDVATHFSNAPGSNQSSLGTFLTGATYSGVHGLSLRLRGLDAGVNDNAFSRAIVIHGADYVNSDIVHSLGRLGRSLGCPALATDVAPRIIGLIKEGTVLYAYGSRTDGQTDRQPGRVG
jgi:hypothetical protein